MSEELVNKGVSFLNFPSSSAGTERPLVVVGVARGGTSMVAGVLHHLGVFMGDEFHAPVFEDVRLAEAMESGEWRAANAVVSDYKSRGIRWGWKRPSIVNYLDEADKALENPAYIFVFKDIFSIAQRNSISMLSDTLKAMNEAQQQYRKILNFLEGCSAPAMLVSYEKALAYPKEFVEKVVQFSHLDCDAQQQDKALEFMEPAPKKYLDVSRITKSQGRLDGLREGKLFGWARFVHTSKTANVELFLNDSSIGQVEASGKRSDLKERFNQDCAFVFNVPDSITFEKGDQLRARVDGDFKDLNNSPFTVAD